MWLGQSQASKPSLGMRKEVSELAIHHKRCPVSRRVSAKLELWPEYEAVTEVQDAQHIVRQLSSRLYMPRDLPLIIARIQAQLPWN